VLGGSSPTNLTNIDGTLVFRASDGIHHHELWKSDGTEVGTVLLKDIMVDSIGNAGYPSGITKVNNKFFFNANSKQNGYELWQSDGSSEGTRLVKDIQEGTNSSSPAHLTNINGTLFFSADDGLNGSELWQTDGTEAGTSMVKDIRIGVGGSNPRNLTNIDGTLFFTANDGIHGEELWAIINHTPVAINNAYNLNANTTLYVSSPGILNNDTDLDGDLLSAILETNVSYGFLSLDSNGAFNYTPTVGYTGLDTFTYYNSDGQLNSEIAIVELTVKKSGTVNISGDFDSDNDVDKDDLAMMRERFGQNANGLDDPFDVNQDGVINVLDFRQIIKLCTRPSCSVH